MGTKTFRNWYSSKGYMGYSTIRDGIVYSMNIVAVRCMIETVTPQLGVEYAKPQDHLLTDSDYNASTALGGITKGVSNLELTDAFAAIANGGIYTKPVFFTQILDTTEKFFWRMSRRQNVFSKDSTAFLLTDAMAQSMESSRMFASSGVSLNSTSAVANIRDVNAGKSGTTTSNNDIWFVGFTRITAGIWSDVMITRRSPRSEAALPTTRRSGEKDHDNNPRRTLQIPVSRFRLPSRPPRSAEIRKTRDPRRLRS